MKSLVGKKIKVGTNEVAIIYFYVNYLKSGLKSNWADMVVQNSKNSVKNGQNMTKFLNFVPILISTRSKCNSRRF